MLRSFSLFLTLAFICFSVDAKILTVCSNCIFTSIKSALEIAENGDRIEIKQGVYEEGNIPVNKEVELVGLNYPVVDGQYQTEIFTITANNVRISGFQLQNVGTSYTEDRAAIKILSRKNCLIENNKLFDTFFGIYLAHSKDCIVRNNEIIGQAQEEHSSGNAIHLWYCKKITVENNYTAHHRDGIYLEFVDSCRIEGNTVEGNIRYGLHFMFSDNNVYKGNVFKTNNAGVAVMYSNYITMLENRFLDNWGSASYGILLKEIKDSYMFRNVFEGNTIGLYAEGSNRIKIEQNDFIRNGWAVKIMGNCEDNVFAQNNFINNTFELTTNARESSNTFDGNFWSKYTGYDLDKDGVGDVPHSPIDLFTYLVEQQPPSIILLRSLFIDLLNLAEKITPSLTPSSLADSKPLMKMVKW